MKGYQGICSVCNALVNVEPSLLLATNVINGDASNTGAKSIEQLFVISKHNNCGGNGTQPATVIEVEE